MRKSLQGILLIIYFFTVVVLASCKKTPQVIAVAPTVVTNTVVSQLTSTTVISGGVVTSLEINDAVGKNGVCWSTTNPSPTVDDSKTTDSVQTHFVSNVTGLLPNTTYYMRAYAISNGGTGYGGVITFKTTSTNTVPVGVVTTIAGNTSGNAGFADGTGSGVLFSGPQSIAYNSYSGLLYVGDLFNNQIRTVTTTGTTQTLTTSTRGYVNGPLSTAAFYGPQGFSFDAQGNTYVADLGNDVIRKITSAGVVSTFAGNGSAGYIDGVSTAAEFYNPQSTARDAAGNIYVADRTNNLIRKIAPTGTVSVLAGGIAPAGVTQSAEPGYVDGAPAIAQFSYPCAMAIDASGNLFVCDLSNHAIREVTPTGNVVTIVGGPNFPHTVGVPNGIALDAQGDIFVTDSTGRILEITVSRTVYILAGAENTSGYTEGTGAAARFNNPQGLAFDGQGNLYVSDSGNNVIRKIALINQ